MSQGLKVLVTGGAGYLGSTVAGLLLSSGHTVRVIDCLSYGGHSVLGFWNHPAFEFVRGDIRDQRMVRRSLKGIDVVIHLAAIVGDLACAKQPVAAREINLEASLKLLDECRRAQIERFILASSCSNYGRSLGSDEYVDERSMVVPLSLYAKTKVECETALLEMGTFAPLSFAILRFATLFGVSPRMRFDLTVNEFTLRMLTRKHLVVFAGQSWRPYVHVRDAARAVEIVLRSPNNKWGQVYNVGSTTQNFKKRDLAEFVRAHAADAHIEYIDQWEDPRDYRVCFTKISRDLGFLPTRTVQDGIAEVAHLIRSGAIPRLDDPYLRNDPSPVCEAASGRA
ncbi:MAG: NAD(P)-dependent oxidoreductase [Acidobacteriaceae bacterium]|nr:NAD(P)-dependent oxidoreductase [Acidobacteriaceae bacterium]